ncbi:hypothetical protein ABZ297_19345 [Nonomuraea sp. NPDC005983]|uniref:hypothetical protein n=1 Tax=Nonomuraea sp. NPDC005983 TaxID=3155595 RepID=UPI0033B44345
MSTGDELRAAVSARRDLGPEFEDAIVDSFLDKMGKEVDRRVDERLVAVKGKKHAGNDGQRLALAIVSLALGTLATVAIVVTNSQSGALFLVWAGIALVNLIFSRR